MTTEAQTWIVMEAKTGITPVLAWCRWTAGPRFEDLVLTAMDGMSEPPEDLDVSKLRMERFLFQVEEGHQWDTVTNVMGLPTGDFRDREDELRAHPLLAAAPFDAHAAVIMALTELGQDGVLEIIAEQDSTIDVLADPEIVTAP